MASVLRRYFVAPRTPSTAAGFVDDDFVVVDLRRSGHQFRLASSAVTELPRGLITPGLDSRNITDPDELVSLVRETVEAAGLANRRRWAVAMPEGSARTIVIALESKPGSRQELDEILLWKVERLIATPTAELRMSRQRLTSLGGHDRYLVTVARTEVLSEYESVFQTLGWQTGLLLPRHLGELQWLIWSKAAGDKMLISASRDGFTSVVVRNAEPVFIRNYSCEMSSRADELHRFALYYRDKIAGPSPDLSGLLVLGGVAATEAREAVAEAIEFQPSLLDPSEFGFDLRGDPISFDQLAGPAGLASISWT